MLVNMSLVKNRQINISTALTNGSFAPICGISAGFSGMFASKISYGSPASVSKNKP